MKAGTGFLAAPLAPSHEGPAESRLSPFLKSRLERVLRKRGKARVDEILASERPGDLVRALPELEVHLTVQEVGKRDCLELLDLVTPQQLHYLVDLDVWKKDRLDPLKMIEWLEILMECEEEKLAEFVRSADLELIVFLLKKFIRVTKLAEDSPSREEGEAPFSPDHLYSISFRDEKSRDVLQPFLKRFLSLDSDLYRRAMEGVLWELESDLEEAAYRWRNARLADLGFPSFQESLEIYRFVNPQAVPPGGKIPLPGETGENGLASAMPMCLQETGPFFASALRRLDDPAEREGIQRELVALFNKAIIAESLDDFSREGMERVGRKVFHYLNLGLQALCRVKGGRPEAYLQTIPLQKIFQCGFGSTLLLKRKAEEIFKGPWFEGDRKNLAFLDFPHGEIMKGLLRKRPVFYRSGLYMDFENLADLRELEMFLEMISAAVQFLGDSLGVSSRELREMDWRGCHPDRWQDMTLSTILLTSWANRVLKGFFRFAPLEKEQVPLLLQLIFEEEGGDHRVIKKELCEKTYDWLKSAVEDEEKRAPLQRFWAYCFGVLEEEFGRIPPALGMDPRYTRGLLIRAPRSGEIGEGKSVPATEGWIRNAPSRGKEPLPPCGRCALGRETGKLSATEMIPALMRKPANDEN